MSIVWGNHVRSERYQQAVKYNLYYKGNAYPLTRIIPTNSLTSGFLRIFVEGEPFAGETEIYGDIIIRTNDMEVNKAFNENLDEVENFLLNRNINPIYFILKFSYIIF